MPRRRRRIWASHDSVKLQSGETASLSGRAHPAADAGRAGSAKSRTILLPATGCSDLPGVFRHD